MIAAAVLLACVLLAAGIWRGTGGRWMQVETGSMGPAAPVGTLVLTRPVTVHELHPGDIVSFRTSSGGIYTHRVVAVTSDFVTTQGDNNGSVDPYRTGNADLVGKVVARWWGIGWILRAAPYLLVFGAALWFLTSRMRGASRPAVRLFGSTLIAAGIMVIQHPLVGAEVASAAATEHGARASVVATGILPVVVHASGGNSVVLQAGQQQTVTGQADDSARLPLTISPHLTGWWLVAVVLWCALPLAIAILIAARSARARKTA